MPPIFVNQEVLNMKSFANCTPDEFMTQAIKFRAPFAEWCDNIGVKEIRARRPEGFNKMKDKEKAEALGKIAVENMGEILAAAMEKDAEGTKEVMCLATFTEPEDFNKHTMVEYLAAILEMLNSREVKGFFTYYLSPKMKSSFKA